MIPIVVRTLALAILALGLVIPAGLSQGTIKVQPKLEAIAETRLLMEGLAQANFKGLERLLAQKPSDAQSWTFARGQALLIAETANLLMLRPPRNQGEPVWFERAMDLRKQASILAQVLAKRDFEGSRTALANLANTCNRCHQTFRVKVQIVPFAEQPPPQKVQLEQ